MGKVKQPPKRDERVTVSEWRFHELVDLGIPPDAAVNLIDIPDVVHSARELLKNGCPPHLIASLLEE